MRRESNKQLADSSGSEHSEYPCTALYSHFIWSLVWQYLRWYEHSGNSIDLAQYRLRKCSIIHATRRKFDWSAFRGQHLGKRAIIRLRQFLTRQVLLNSLASSNYSVHCNESDGNGNSIFGKLATTHHDECYTRFPTCATQNQPSQHIFDFVAGIRSVITVIR